LAEEVVAEAFNLAAAYSLQKAEFEREDKRNAEMFTEYFKVLGMFLGVKPSDSDEDFPE